MTGNRERWHLDKTVNISVVLAIFVQGAIGVWWGSAINTRVSTVEAHSLQVDANIAKMAADATSDRDRILASAAEANVRTARLEERYTAIDDVLKRLDDKMDKIIDSQRPRTR